MKKLIALMLCLTMALSLAACTNDKPVETKPVETKPVETTTVPTTEAAPVAASALEILETVWALYGEDEKFFVMGGDFDAPVDGAPGAAANTDWLTGTLLIPEDQLANVKEAASIAHGMMINNFACGAFLVEGDAKAFAEAMHTKISTNPWICGQPEKMVIAVLGDFVVTVYGVNDAVNPFETKLTTAYPTAELVYSEAING